MLRTMITILNQSSTSDEKAEQINSILDFEKLAKMSRDELSDVSTDLTLSPDLRNYVTGFVRLISPFENPSEMKKLATLLNKDQDVARKYDVARGKLFKENHGIFDNLMRKIAISESDPRQQQASNALILSALRGGRMATLSCRRILWNKIKAKRATETEQLNFYVLTVLNALDVKVVRGEVHDLADLYYTGTYGILQNVDEAIFWYAKSNRTKDVLNPGYFQPTPGWYILSCENRRSNQEMIHSLRDTMMFISHPNSEFYLNYLNSLFLNSEPKFEDIVRIALLSAELKEHLLAAKAFIYAAEITSNLHDKLSNIQSAWAEATKIARPSGLRLKAEILCDLENMLKTSAQKELADDSEKRQIQKLAEVYASFNQEYDDNLNSYKMILLEGIYQTGYEPSRSPLDTTAKLQVLVGSQSKLAQQMETKKMASESEAIKSERKETRIAVPTDPKVDKKTSEALEKEKEMDRVLENIKNIFKV